MVTVDVNKSARQAVNLVKSTWKELRTQSEAIHFMYQVLQEKYYMPDVFSHKITVKEIPVTIKNPGEAE